MRLWLKDSERRPDPAPFPTDDRTPILIGLVAWVVGLVVMLVFVSNGDVPDRMTWVTTCALGIVLGLLGLVYTHRRRAK